MVRLLMIPMDAHYIRTKFQWFVSNPPCSSFKKLIVLTPRLLRSLHTMSLAKKAPGGLKDHECKKMALREHPPIPYVLEKTAYKRRFLPTRISTSRRWSKKVRSYEFLSGTLARARLFSFTWDLLKKRFRKRVSSSPLRNIPKLTPTSARRSRNWKTS